MKTIQKQFICILTLFFVLIFSCKKIESDKSSINWDLKKVEIANKVKEDLNSLKALLPFTISRANNDDVSFDNLKINEYYKVQNPTANNVIAYKAPKNTGDIIANIKAQKLSNEPIEDDEPGEPIGVSPDMALVAEGYRNQYWMATNDYQDLASYLVQLNNIASDLIASQYVSTDEKVMMYFEIEMLKQYATDLETNPNYWIELYAPQELSLTGSVTAKGSSVMSIGSESLADKVIMSPPYHPGGKKNGCKINVRGVLAGAVLSGLANGVRAGTVGLVAGTVTVPGIGTVTGAVSGFMSGFAVGFVSGIVSGVVVELMTSCGR